MLLTAVIGAGCGNGLGSRDKYLQAGDQQAQQGKLPDAILSYKSALAADPRSAVAYQKLADAYVLTGAGDKALDAYVRAADLLPNDVPAQISAGKMLLIAQRWEDARSRADKALAINPKDAEALILLGNALAGLRDISGAMETIQRSIAADPTKGFGYAHLGVLQAATGRQAEAEASFKRAIAAEPESAIPRLGLMNLYWATGQLEKAEQVLKEAVSLDPQNFVANQSLAYFYINTNRIAAAEAPLKVIAGAAPDSPARFLLADYYVLSNRGPEAKVLLNEAAKSAVPEHVTAARLRLAVLGFADKDHTETHRILNDILAKQPKQTEALVAKAQLLRAEGKHDEAVATVKQAVASNPGSAQAHYVLGNLYGDARQFQEAIAEQKEAVRHNPSHGWAVLELAKLSLTLGQPEDALAYSRDAIRMVPSEPSGYLQLIRSLLATNKTDAAEPPLRSMQKQFPDDPAVLVEVGKFELRKGNLTASRAAYEKAWMKGQPAEAMQGLLTLDIAQNAPEAARRRVVAAMQANPGNAELRMLAGRTFLAIGDFKEAERALKQALGDRPGDIEGYGYLASLYIQQNRVADATTEFQNLAKAQPRNVAYVTMVATLLHIQKKYDEAKAHYERALGLDPRASVACNNLAQLYLDRNENLDVALSLAQTAKAGMPNSHAVDDTLGWAYYKKGIGASAVPPLQNAVKAQPNNAVYLYHLGAAQALVKDKTNARVTLEKALKAQPSFDGVEDARKLLDSLKR